MNWKTLQEATEIGDILNEHVVDKRVAPHAVAGWAQFKDGSWQGGFGSAQSSDTRQPFDLASVSKPVFAVCVASLVRDGVVSWDEKLCQLLPETKGTWGGERTVEQHLSHRAGLVPHLPFYEPSWHGLPAAVSDVVHVASRAARSEAREDPVYCDLGFILCGLGVSRRMGRPLDHVIAERVTVPWGLEVGSARAFSRDDSGFFKSVAPTEIQPPRGGLLKGVVHDDNAWMLSGFGVSGHAGQFGTVEGVLRLGAQLLTKCDEDWLAPLFKRRPGGSLRLGLDGVSGPKSLAGTLAGSETFGHLGFTGTSFWCDPERQRVTVLLTNRVYPTRMNRAIVAVRPKIHDFLWAC